MNRPLIHRLAWMFLLPLMAAPGLVQGAVDPDHRNVLLIVIDDLRVELGCYGHSRVRSPHLDRLSAQGRRFERAYVQYPVCNPSRSSFLTGLRPDTTGVLDNRVPFRQNLPDVVTLPQCFRDQGYFTASLGKVFHGGIHDDRSWDVEQEYQATALGRTGERRNMTGGAVSWCWWMAANGEDEDQPDGQVAREGIKLLEQKKDGPFFIALGFHKPHDPFIAPKKYFDLYPPDSLKIHRDPQTFGPDPEPAITGPWAREFAKFTDRERREFLRSYYAGTSFTDAQIGKVFEAMDRLKLWDNTVVMALGDHGYHLGERAWWNKNTAFELSARAPLIVWSPDLKAPGQATSALVEFLDLYPTLTDLCGLKAPGNLPGRSFRGLLLDPSGPGREAAFTQVKRGPVMAYSVRTDRWRYTEWNEGREGLELYDHARDPGEWTNLARDPTYQETLDRLRTLLRRGNN